MKDTNYQIKRNEIFVGSLVNVTKDMFKEFDNPLNIMVGDLSDSKKESMIECFGHLYTHKPSLSLNKEPSYKRTILFTLDESNYANDLLFDSPHYPVMNISENKACINSSFVIDRCFNLDKILKYYNYSNLLQFTDILNIKEHFFKNGDYILNNAELFGIIETNGLETGMECTDSKGVYRTFNDTVENHLKYLNYQGVKKENLPNYNVVFDECYFIAFWLSGRYSLEPDYTLESNVKKLAKERR